MKYRKIPVIIEAYKVKDLLHSANEDWKSLPDCIREAYEKGGFVFGYNCIRITTLEGIMKAGINDYIIKGIQGELYPCKPSIFEQTYEEVS